MAKVEKYKLGEETFINPYNFVSVTDKNIKKVNAEESRAESLHTGRLHCSLEVKTPLVIPGDVKEEKNDHKKYGTYMIGDKIAIPGSSIRGMLRSVYEAATNSCMSTTNPSEHITKRTASKYYKPCILKREKDNNGKDIWKLYEAERIALVGNDKKYKEITGDYVRYDVRVKSISDGDKSKCEKYIIGDDGEKLYFGQRVEIQENPIGHLKLDRRTGEKREVWNNRTVGTIRKGGKQECFLYLGEAISSKHAESVFRSKNLASKYTPQIIEEALKGLESTLVMYRSESINRNLDSKKENEKHYGYYGYERAKKEGIIPLWYTYSDGKLYLSLAAIGRIAYYNTMKDIMNYHESCKDRKSLCPACSVFGMVGKTKDNDGMGSLIRVTDAFGIGEIDIEKEVTLRELGTPRTSYLKFYSTDGKQYDSQGVVIRGRKFFWHNPSVNEDNTIYSTTEITNRNGTFELIKTGNVFEFDVYYDSLTDEQLEMLVWTINLPKLNDDKKELMHKLGHGKPLGLGSIKISIVEKYERDLTDGFSIKRVAEAYMSSEYPQLLHRNSWSQLEKIMRFDSSVIVPIRYPYVVVASEKQEYVEEQKQQGKVLKDNILASHQWFSNNKLNLPMPQENLQMKIYECSEINDKDFQFKFERGIITSLKTGFGFIKTDTYDTVFFRESVVENCSFEKLSINQEVQVCVVPNKEDGFRAIKVRIPKR